MRQWIDLVEAWDRQFRIYDSDVDVHKNPSRTEFFKLLKETRARHLRGMVAIDTHDLYVWDAYSATHSDVDSMFRRQEDRVGFHSAYLILYEDHLAFNDINYDRNEHDDWKTYPYDWYLSFSVAAARACPSLVHIYGADFVPIGHDNDTGENFRMTPEWLAKNCRPRQEEK